MVNLPEHIWAEPVAFKITKITMYVLILVLSTVGNSAVIVVICRSKRRRSVAGNLLILNLALCDLLTPLLSIPFDLALEENSYKWLYGEAMCTLLAPAATLTSLRLHSSLTDSAISSKDVQSLEGTSKNVCEQYKAACDVETAVAQCSRLACVQEHSATMRLPCPNADTATRNPCKLDSRNVCENNEGELLTPFLRLPSETTMRSSVEKR